MALYDFYAASKIGKTVSLAVANGSNTTHNLFDPATTFSGNPPVSNAPILFIVYTTDNNIHIRQTDAGGSATATSFFLFPNTYMPILVESAPNDGFLAVYGNGNTGTVYVTVTSKFAT